MVDKVRVYLDASVILRLSLGNPATVKLLLLRLAGVPLEIVSSAYALQEVLRTMAQPEWPTKAAFAVVVLLGGMIIEDLIHIRSSLPTVNQTLKYSELCRDEKDWPILADAVAENCNVILTEDKDFLDAVEKIKQHILIHCESLEGFLTRFTEQPEVAATLQSYQQLTNPSGELGLY